MMPDVVIRVINLSKLYRIGYCEAGRRAERREHKSMEQRAGRDDN